MGIGRENLELVIVEAGAVIVLIPVVLVTDVTVVLKSSQKRPNDRRLGKATLT